MTADAWTDAECRCASLLLQALPAYRKPDREGPEHEVVVTYAEGAPARGTVMRDLCVCVYVCVCADHVSCLLPQGTASPSARPRGGARTRQASREARACAVVRGVLNL